MRRTLAAAAVVAAALTTGGCTVPAVGAVGIGVDANGDPVGFVQVCRDHIDGATIYLSTDDARIVRIEPREEDPG